LIKEAAKKGDVEGMKALFEEGEPHGVTVDVQDESGYTPLYTSTMYGKEDTVAECIKMGAKVDLENNNGVTPLMAAARDGYTAIVQMLLEAGADVYQVDEFDRTADSVAAEKGFEEVRLERLLLGLLAFFAVLLALMLALAFGVPQTANAVKEWIKEHPKA
jgi:ankyrin repeat protein